MSAVLKGKLLFISCLALLGMYAVAPSIIYFSLPKEIRNDDAEFQRRVPQWLPRKHVKLGLDLQGGVQLVLGVTVDEAVDNKIGRLASDVMRWAEDEKLALKSARALKQRQTLRVEWQGEQPDSLSDKLRKEYPGLMQSGRGDDYLDFQFEEDELERVKNSALEQAERVVRNRIDKWGVTEPVINRPGSMARFWCSCRVSRIPEKAKELLGRTAQLKFQIVDDEFTGFDKLKNDLPEGIELVDESSNQLAFTSYDQDTLRKFLQAAVPDDLELLFQREVIAGGKQSRFTSWVVFPQSDVSGEDVLDAQVGQGDNIDRTPEVLLRFTGPGGRRFAEVTGNNVKKTHGYRA